MTENLTKQTGKEPSKEPLKPDRTYKDRLFRMIFRDKEQFLELYNAINGTSYTNPEDLTVTTLENVVYMGMRNDVSFLLYEHLTLYEHQSTANPNMPLRNLFYVADVYSRLTADANLYSSTLIRLPSPQFVVFYNGREPQEEQTIQECISEGILSDFLLRNRAEVKKVSIYEYNEEKHLQQERDEAMEKGRLEGLQEGLLKGHCKGLTEARLLLIQSNKKKGLDEAAIAEFLEAEPSFVHRVFELIDQNPKADTEMLLTLLGDK